ncbi:hypothetical protein JK636_15790 [Clostridium sp. YIM B02515]|uniref:Uncharacterized protein n=1 Tax=Clostridium rhizosphaerae TaxID=2803861 RepID=A0ABS1TFU8_9CLOT|nr:hypothetical protein [Clostridium rhizosphaerae]MBL4937189.1 hypothetical protein [Clostridium rhizosphaerae]
MIVTKIIETQTYLKQRQQKRSKSEPAKKKEAKSFNDILEYEYKERENQKISNI